MGYRVCWTHVKSLAMRRHWRPVDTLDEARKQLRREVEATLSSKDHGPLTLLDRMALAQSTVAEVGQMIEATAHQGHTFYHWIEDADDPLP